MIISILIIKKQEGNADPALKPDFYIFLLFFQHKWMFLCTMQTLPLEGHNVAYQCKGLCQSNILCEYEVNLSTNEKLIIEKQNLTQIVKEQCWISRSSEGQDATCW